MNIKINDKVIVLSGEDKGKIGEVLKVFPKIGKVLVSKINIIKKTVKPNNERKDRIIEKENAINVSKIMLVCNKCNKPTKIKRDILSDNKKVRICKKCGEIII